MPNDGPSGGRPYRGAIVGFGSVARAAHLPGFRYDAAIRRRIEIVAAVDTDPGAGDGVDIPVVPDWAALRGAAGAIDFVDICTPTATHVRVTLEALAEGYHVLCEKPAAITPAEARSVAAAAHAARRTVMPSHQYRFNPAWRQMRAWLDAGAIGHWHLAEVAVYRPAADGAGSAGVPWRGTRSGGVGGILLDHGTHMLYTLADLAGVPTVVRAWTARLRHRAYDVEDTAQVVLEYPGRVAVVFLTWAAQHRENRVRFIGEQGTIEWTGGILRLDAGSRTESLDMTAQLDKRMYPAWFAAQFAAFAQALDAGGTAEAPLADIERVAVLIDAAYRAAECGTAVSLSGAGAV